ncbi:glycosyltransferase [Sphingomonas sanguinis]|uniref:glycosyltransferase n=1 Tax=Sphingomonas sanguinis TaxID=33051 RepID=UPI001C59FEAB|nr:glycosyltransferase [Sphingomonas sanguinis]QXT35547.1 glycosyltransferase [Sphingomonas sanguinis]
MSVRGGATSGKRVLAIASGGGHWEQLQLLRGAFDGHDVHFATTLAGLGERAGLTRVTIVPDCNRNEPVRAVASLFAILRLLVRVRPAVVISTGALPGVIALALGRRLGARTIWVDSIANAETMSMAGLKAKRYADLWLSQWPDVAREFGAEYAGSVL